MYYVKLHEDILCTRDYDSGESLELHKAGKPACAHLRA